MRKTAASVVWLLILCTISFAKLEKSKLAQISKDSIIQDAIAKAPYYSYKVNLLLRRLAVDDAPELAVRELAVEMRHFCPSLQTRLYEQSLLATLFMNTSPRGPGEYMNSRSGLVWADIDSTFQKVNGTDKDCWNPAMAMSKTGDLILVVWQDERRGAANPDIYGQYFDPSLAAIGTNFKIHSESGSAAQSTPAIAATSDGGFVVVWEDDRDGRPTIYWRGFDSLRVAKGDEKSVDITQGKNQYFAAVSADSVGYFTVVWLQDDDGDNNIYARKFANSGQEQYAGFRVNTDTGDQTLQWSPEVASANDGSTLIVWEDKRNGNSDVYGQRMKADGSKQAGNFKVNDIAGSSIQWRPSVAAKAGRFITCWEDYRQQPNTVYAKWFDASLLELAPELRVDESGEQGSREYPTIALNQKGECLFAWQDSRANSWDIYARRFDANQVAQETFTLSADTADGDQTRPAVQMLDNSAVFVWLNQLQPEETQNVFIGTRDWQVVPVELSSFRATVTGNNVRLEWNTASESGNFGFEVQRKTRRGYYEKVGFVAGHGTTSRSAAYFYEDRELPPGTYSYRLKQIDNSGDHSFSESTVVMIAGPAEFSLQQNYPNPFNPSTRIRYALPEETLVDLRILNLNGQVIRALVTGHQAARVHEVEWDGKDDRGQQASSGIYFCRLQAGDFSQTRRLVLMR